MTITPSLPEQFQQQLFELINNLLPTDGLRFHVYVPGEGGLKLEVGSDLDIDEMSKEYSGEHWQSDPMHPSHFEGTDRIIVTNTQLMTDIHWQNTDIYRRLFEPHAFFHDADIFFRQQERIFAVLTLLRKDKSKPFLSSEIELLSAVQPFIEFSLSQVYLPKRVYNRESLADEFDLTAREIDVAELALTGASNKVLAAQLKISLPTLRTHLQNIYNKTGVHSTAELIAKLMTLLN